jgi:hypothetical protein
MGGKSIILLSLTALLIFFTGSAASCLLAFDPAAIGIGVQALGMGKAAVTMIGSDSLFNNPATLGEVNTFRFTSLGGKLLEDVNYTVLGATQPLGKELTIGFGLVASSVSDIELRDINKNLLQNGNYENNLVLVALGKKISDNLSLGTTLKYYLTNNNVLESAGGSGFNLDVGLLKQNEWLTLGLCAKNILSSSYIVYKNGERESLPSQLEVGASGYLFGNRFDSLLYAPFNLVISSELVINQGSLPFSSRWGVEFSPLDLITLRAGSDQGNMTGGISLKFLGLGFHLAYLPNAAGAFSFFSLTFNERGWPSEEYPTPYLAEKL